MCVADFDNYHNALQNAKCELGEFSSVFFFRMLFPHKEQCSTVYKHTTEVVLSCENRR